MDRDIKDVLETVIFIKERVEQLPTEDRVREIVREEIRAVLEELSEKVENVTGYRKEIDHALERIAAIEKNLGMDKKVAA